jgi:hypothetical protein
LDGHGQRLEAVAALAARRAGRGEEWGGPIVPDSEHCEPSGQPLDRLEVQGGDSLKTKLETLLPETEKVAPRSMLTPLPGGGVL